MRSILSPALTTGRIKKMVGLMNEPAAALVEHLSQVAPGAGINIRAKTTAFVLDVTATVAFGIKVSALDDPDNPFVVKGRQSFTPTPDVQRTISFVLASLYPSLAQYAEPPAMTSGIAFFAGVAADIIKSRKALPPDAPKRNDLVDVLLEAAETHKMFQEDEKLLIAQLVTFLIGGLDTTAFTMSMVLHCLAMNPEVQEWAREELTKAIAAHGGGVNYDVIRELPFMDQCMTEAMRLYPTAARLDRVCTKDMAYPGAFTLKKGMSVIVPVYALHMNPEYYPDPEAYNPNRFSAEAKRARAGEEGPFLGFGSGNRACLGMRFAKDNMKLGLAHLLWNFRFVPVAETRHPPPIEVAMLGFLHNEDCWLGVEKLAK